MMSRSQRRQIGATLIGSGLVVPVATVVGSQIWLRSIPQVPPNQGAMVVAFLASVAALGFGVVAVCLGGLLMLIPPRE
jgi:hypothetical protein